MDINLTFDEPVKRDIVENNLQLIYSLDGTIFDYKTKYLTFLSSSDHKNVRFRINNKVKSGIYKIKFIKPF
ncbi:MAG: hypothetical protein H7263_16475 [Candidatus Sericytochromatia bacterium]|nr:hypothetical protein [Candidatus Sericytochromatia bacterium]